MLEHSHNPIFEIFEHTYLISTFVLVMMMLIEYITVLTKGNWSKPIKKSPWFQVVFASLLGIIPGCLGTFAAVSLYAHRILNFAALVAVMIATSGDEAFVMFSLMPQKAIILSLSIFTIALLTGFTINIFNKNKSLMVLPENHLNFSHDEFCRCFNKQTFIKDIFTWNTRRFVLLAIGLVFILLLALNKIGPSSWNWEKTMFFIAGVIGFAIILTVPKHFLEDHIWNHVIKKHFLKIFLWILGAFIFIHFLEDFIDVTSWIRNNYYYVLLIAVLIGVIPESGPHIVFITLFLNGTIPFSILLANSIVQDGHGAIPLLAESKKSFFAMKAINVLVALIIGVLMQLFGL